MHDRQTWNQSFTTAPSRAQRFVSDLLSRLPSYPAGTKLEVLDLGCGTGAPAFQFASVCPDAHVTGIDISDVSIATAERTRQQFQHSERLRFIAQDYMECRLGPFDLIYSDSCLHLIPQSDELLFDKLARDLKPGGHLAFSIPRQCLYNSALTLLRRCFRLVQSRASDYLIMKAAQVLHGPSTSAEFLRERVHYMYCIPRRFGARDLEKRLELTLDLNGRGMFEYAHASWGQYKHGLWIFQKGSASERLAPLAA